MCVFNKSLYGIGTFDWKHNGGAKIEMVYRGTHSSGAQWTESRVPATGFDPGLSFSVFLPLSLCLSASVALSL